MLTVGEAETCELVQEANRGILDGRTLLLADGCEGGLLLATQGYPQRGVDRTNTESVVLGPQEGFVENLRTNITLIRRIVRSESLIGETLSVGTALRQVVLPMPLVWLLARTLGIGQAWYAFWITEPAAALYAGRAALRLLQAQGICAPDEPKK